MYPGEWLAFNALANDANLMGRYQIAVDAAARAVELDPRQIFGQMNLLTALIALNRFDEAKGVAGRMLERDPDNSSAHTARYAMADFLGDIWSSNRADHDLLAIIDGLPSLDPFLLREQLKRHGRDPARCYFEISDADISRMFGFVEREMQKLINLCYADGEAPAVKSEAEERRGSRLVQKILSATVDAETEPLRLTLRLEKREYQEGVFCWKGFLYYKWTLSEALPDVTRVADAISCVKPRGGSDSETLALIDKTRSSLRASILGALEAASKSLRFYDAAFDGLIGGRPTAFREFLLSAPAMFCDLGERLGAVNHIVSFWNFRFPQGKLPTVTGPELIDILVDFEESLAFNENAAIAQRLAS
jgi:tetratricopeptide (TPR) repeat protein